MPSHVVQLIRVVSVELSGGMVVLRNIPHSYESMVILSRVSVAREGTRVEHVHANCCAWESVDHVTRVCAQFDK